MDGETQTIPPETDDHPLVLPDSLTGLLDPNSATTAQLNERSRRTMLAAALGHAREANPITPADQAAPPTSMSGRFYGALKKLVHTGAKFFGFDVGATVDHVESGARNRSAGQCARYVRQALERGGIDTSGHPTSAADYKGFLDGKGFSRVPPDDWIPKPGDIIVFDRVPGHPHGHIQITTENGFCSDFRQKGFLPSRAYEGKPFTVYRHNGLMDGAPMVASAAPSARGLKAGARIPTFTGIHLT